MWVDKTYYWAWSGEYPPTIPPPTVRRLDYAHVESPNGKHYNIHIVCTVYNDGIPTEVNREELAWHERFGAKVTIPNFRTGDGVGEP